MLGEFARLQGEVEVRAHAERYAIQLPLTDGVLQHVGWLEVSSDLPERVAAWLAPEALAALVAEGSLREELGEMRTALRQELLSRDPSVLLQSPVVMCVWLDEN